MQRAKTCHVSSLGNMKFDRQWAVCDIKEKKLNAFIERTKPSFSQDVLPAIHYGHLRDKTERDPVKINDHVKVQKETQRGIFFKWFTLFAPKTLINKNFKRSSISCECFRRGVLALFILCHFCAEKFQYKRAKSPCSISFLNTVVAKNFVMNAYPWMFLNSLVKRSNSSLTWT